MYFYNRYVSDFLLILDKFSVRELDFFCSQSVDIV